MSTPQNRQAPKATTPTDDDIDEQAALPKRLWCTTIKVWSTFNPHSMETSQLVKDGEEGGSFISSSETTVVTDKARYPTTDFFHGRGD